MGLGALMFPGRPGDPDSDSRLVSAGLDGHCPSQQVLSFQRHSNSETYEEIRARMGWKSRPLRIVAPMFGALMRRRSPYYKMPGRYADPWGRIRDRWGDPGPDEPQCPH